MPTHRGLVTTSTAVFLHADGTPDSVAATNTFCFVWITLEVMYLDTANILNIPILMKVLFLNIHHSHCYFSLCTCIQTTLSGVTLILEARHGNLVAGTWSIHVTTTLLTLNVHAKHNMYESIKRPLSGVGTSSCLTPSLHHSSLSSVSSSSTSLHVRGRKTTIHRAPKATRPTPLLVSADYQKFYPFRVIQAQFGVTSCTGSLLRQTCRVTHDKCAVQGGVMRDCAPSVHTVHQYPDHNPGDMELPFRVPSPIIRTSSYVTKLSTSVYI